MFIGKRIMHIFMGLTWRVVSVLILVVFTGVILPGCDKNDVKKTVSLDESAKETDDCIVCERLALFVKQVKSDTDEEHSFGYEMNEYYQQIVSDGVKKHAFLAKPQPLFVKPGEKQCNLSLEAKFKEWLPNIERQAEEIAQKQQSCSQRCPEYNCGEYVDFSGMNMEIVELLTLLEGRFLDAALSSADVPGLAAGNTAAYQRKLEALLLEGINLVEEVSVKIDNAKDDAYQQSFVEHALRLDDMAQTTTALTWLISADQQYTPALMEALSRLAEGSRQFAYQYDQLFRMNDGGKATASIQRSLALSSLLQLGSYHNVLVSLKRTYVEPDTSAADEELSCYESLAVKLAVTRELFAIASDTVTQCGLQQNCKTNTYPVFDAITQNQQTTESLIGKLNDVYGVLDKVVYSYTSATCN